MPGVRFDIDGGAMFRRAVRLLGDEAAAARLAEELFVRFVVHARGDRMDARARWSWIYRAVTAACLRQLPDGPSAERVGLGPGAERLDEAARAITVLTSFDGLSVDEAAEVLGLPSEQVRRLLPHDSASARPSPSSPSSPSSSLLAGHPSSLAGHPSSLALDRGDAGHAGHLSSCSRCQAAVAEGERLGAHFAHDLVPAARERVIANIRAQRAQRSAGPNWRRIFWMTASTVVVAALALVVARPRKPDRIEKPYAEMKGASRAKKAGLQIVVRRAEEVRNLDPMVALRGGDRLHFRVRADRPRYLEVRVRGPAGDVRVFPDAGQQAALVRPGQSLDHDYLVAGAPGGAAAVAPGLAQAGSSGAVRPPASLWIVASFSDRPFPLDGPAEPDIEEVPVRVDLE